MMADVKWIKITTDIFDDEKILLIESLPDAYAIITVWFKLLCLAGKQNNSGVFMMGRVAYTEKMLATIFRMKEATVTMALQTFEQFGMVEIIDGVITIPNWGKHQNLDQMESRKEFMRNYMKGYRAKQKALTSGDSDSKPNCKPNSKPNVRQAEEEREEERDIDIEEEKKSVRETTPTIFKRLLPDYILSEELQAKMAEWITYKMERKEGYKEQGMKSLLRQVENNALKYGDRAVCELIEKCMASGWKGIIFDKLEKQPSRQGYQKQTKADELNDFYKMAHEWGNQ